MRTPLAARWNGTNWTAESLGLQAGAKGAQLRRVSCVSGGSCTAVGTVTSTAGVETALVVGWSGSSWSTQSVAAPPHVKASHFYGVSCVTAADCTAVGSDLTTEGKNETLAEHWDGEAWLWQSTPNVEGEGFLSGGVACRPGGFCVAVGNKGKSLAMVRSEGSPVSEGAPPTAITGGTWGEPGTSSAILSGTVNPEGSETEFFFEYGTTTAYGLRTLVTTYGAWIEDEEVFRKLSELQPETTYHYRLVASSRYGTVYGHDTTFTTR